MQIEELSNNEHIYERVSGVSFVKEQRYIQLSEKAFATLQREGVVASEETFKITDGLTGILNANNNKEGLASYVKEYGLDNPEDREKTGSQVYVAEGLKTEKPVTIEVIGTKGVNRSLTFTPIGKAPGLFIVQDKKYNEAGDKSEQTYAALLNGAALSNVSGKEVRPVEMVAVWQNDETFATRVVGRRELSLEQGKGEDKIKEAKEEKSYARFNLMTTYYYHQDNEAISKALYNVNLDAMDKEPAVVQDVFRTIAGGKDGTITDFREKDMICQHEYWDTRIIGIHCGEEEYLIEATRLADENNRNEYNTFISVAAPQKELDAFIKKIKDVFEQNHVHGVYMITESKDVSKEYLKSKFDSDKQVLITNDQKLTMPVKSLGFTKEHLAVENEGTKIFVRPEAFTFIKDSNGKAKGISINGYRAPDGEYYKAEMAFKKIDGVSVDVIRNGKFAGWGVVKLDKGAAVSMAAKDEIMITVDGKEFGKFIDQKNRKVARQKEAEKTNSVKAMKGKDAGKENSLGSR